jgi:hypothetical protein
MGRRRTNPVFRHLFTAGVIIALASCVSPRRPGAPETPTAEAPPPAPTTAVEAGVQAGPRLETLGLSPYAAGRALAAFQRKLVATNTPFDRYMRGDTSAMSPMQISGMQAFQDVGCDNCHSGPMLSDVETHVAVVPDQQLGHRIAKELEDHCPVD